MPQHDPIAAKRAALRDAVLSALDQRNRPKLSLDKIADEIGIARTTLTKRLSLVHLDTIEKFARWKRHLAVSRLAGELMVLLGVPPNYVAAIAAQTDAIPKASNIIPFPPCRPPRARRWRPPPQDSERPVYTCGSPARGLRLPAWRPQSNTLRRARRRAEHAGEGCTYRSAVNIHRRALLRSLRAGNPEGHRDPAASVR
jgi:hypothetical protein